MDSLVAVEVRSWFLKEIDVDIPVLKVLGGSSVLDLLDTAIEKIPASVIDLDALEKGESGAPKSSSPPTPPEKSFIPRRAMTENSSLSTPLSTPVDSSSSETGPSSPDSRSPSPGSKTFLERRGPTEEELEKTRRDLIVSSSSETKAEMSFGQSRFWFLHHFLSDKTSFNFSLSARMDGPLRLQAFEEALNLVIQRHEALRTRFFWSEGDTGIPMQGVISTALLKLEKLQISSEAEAEKALQSLQNHVYELENWGAVRVQLLTLSNTVHYFLMGCHHIALDGQSTHIFMSELDKAYQGQALAALPAGSQYRTFAAQQRHEHDSGSFKKEINFFRRNITKDPGAVELFTFSKVPSRRVMEHYK
jgi:hybrid polyketide synthase/nonribosomal peptide synthetase ACE1